MSDQLPTEHEPRATPYPADSEDLSPPPPNPQIGAGLFVALIVAVIVAVVGLAYLFGRSLDDTSQSNDNGQVFLPQAVPQAIPAPPPPGFPPDLPPIPIPFPTPAPVPIPFPSENGQVPPVPFPDEFPPTPVVPPGAAGQQPTLSDHWHSVYGVYSCNQPGQGENKFLPSFQSTQDNTGIHSHADGLIHIHPFVELAAGNNATMRHWFDEMNVEVTPDRILVQNDFDPLTDLVAGDECADGTGPAEILILRWQFDFMALADDGPSPEVFSGGFDEIQFRNEREVYVIAYVSAETDIDSLPLPPQQRFDTLNIVSAVIESN